MIVDISYRMVTTNAPSRWFRLLETVRYGLLFGEYFVLPDGSLTGEQFLGFDLFPDPGAVVGDAVHAAFTALFRDEQFHEVTFAEFL
jgi:hypothetical protein